MKIKTVKIDELISPEYNPRHITPEALESLKQSIDEFGYIDPIIVNQYNNHIVGGNQRYECLKALEYTEIDVIYINEPDLNREKAINIRLNNNSGDWDIGKLDNIFQELELEGFDLTLTGFATENLQPFETSSDTGIPTSETITSNLNIGLKPIPGQPETTNEYTEPEHEIQEDDFKEKEDIKVHVAKGDLYKLGKHRLLCGDSTLEKNYTTLCNNEKMDLIWCDPPYGVSYTEKNEYLNSLGKPISFPKAIENDNKKPEDMYTFWKKAFTLLHKYTKDKMSYYITAPQGGDLLLLLQSIRDSGFMLKHQLIWNKNNHVLGRCDYNYKHEPMIYGWKINKTHNFYGNGKFKTSVWDIPKPLKNDLHPTMKPIELISECILDTTIEDDKVIDVFGGSGSTLIACEQTNRNCYMMELDPYYCQVIINRWETYTGGKAEKIN